LVRLDHHRVRAGRDPRVHYLGWDSSYDEIVPRSGLQLDRTRECAPSLRHIRQYIGLVFRSAEEIPSTA
jgi:hypothetical protein